MRRIVTVALTVAITLGALAGLRPTAALAASPIEFRNPTTDNYKAIWNADPETRENRTWFQLHSVMVDGNQYSPTTRPAATTLSSEVPVTAGNGQTAVVRITTGADVVNKPFRTEPTGQWGPLLVLKNTATLINTPVRFTISVERNGAVLGSTVVEYRYEDAIYNAPAGSREYNSPGGRFWIGCNPTPLDWSAIVPAPTCNNEAVDPEPVDPADDDCTIVGTDGPDVLIGTDGNDVMCGLGGNDRLLGSAGNDRLLGGEGNDTLQGGAGDDTIDGGAGTDRASYADAAGGIVVNLGQLPNPVWDGPAAGDANIGWDEVTGVEAVSATPYADQLLGAGGDDRLDGLGGRDALYGYAGNDTLSGGRGNDRLYGGSGTDALNGRAGTDTCNGGGEATDTRSKCEA